MSSHTSSRSTSATVGAASRADSTYWSRSQTAAYLNVSSKWLAQSGRATGPRYYKFGATVRYRSDEVQAWAAQQRVAR